MFKVGIVKYIDPAKARARVLFPDLDGMMSDWLIIVYPFSSDDCFGLPLIDDQVVCLMDENYEDGCVIGKSYSDVDLPDNASVNVFSQKFKDGTVIEYDKLTHKLTADIKGTVDIIAQGEINIVGDVSVTGSITASGDIVAGSISLENHTHIDPQGGSTGAAQ